MERYSWVEQYYPTNVLDKVTGGEVINYNIEKYNRLFMRHVTLFNNWLFYQSTFVQMLAYKMIIICGTCKESVEHVLFECVSCNSQRQNFGGVYEANFYFGSI